MNPPLNQESLSRLLAGMPLGELRFYPQVGSTNDLALGWAAARAPDLSLVVADGQTRGRGRAGRTWHTPAGAALAFSLILNPRRPSHLSHLTGWGGLAICEALETHLGLAAEIKWPNDVLLDGRKVAGVLPESHWHGSTLQALVLGIGVNVSPASVPAGKMVDFPATCVETVTGRPVNRLALLKAILISLIKRREALGEDEFRGAWEARLAYRGQRVVVQEGGEQRLEGDLLGLDPVGGLQLQLEDGELVTVHTGSLRPRPGPRKGP